MNPRYYIIILILIAILTGGYFIYTTFIYNPDIPDITKEDTEDPVFCTQDVKECEDGSFVSRVAPNCDFTECPSLDNTATSTEAALKPEFTTIKYTGKEFIPKEITIKKDEKIHFLNESDKPMWIGSDLHPTHGQYPIKSDKDCLGSSFDQCGTVGKGKFFEFTFTELGTWGYHNHVAPSQTGTITVK